jgi:CHAD domain-containing protein
MAKPKQVKGIDCNSAAAAGIRSVLITRFGEMVVLHKAALNWSDPEGVHSMRVASRRLRSALRDFSPYVRKRGLTSSVKQIKSIADVLGEVRDQDVAIEALEKTATQAPAEVSAALKEFIVSRIETRDQARLKLKSILQRDQLKQLEADFTAAVAVVTAIGEGKIRRTQSAAIVTYLKMARSVIIDRLQELEKQSDNLYKPFQIEPLHEMRIAAKRLRYALELFQQCWGPSISAYPKRTARLQSALGQVHDYDIWIESFGKHIVDVKKRKENDHADAFDWLLSHFIKLRTRSLREAFVRWREWEIEGMSGKLREVLHAPARAPESGSAGTSTKEQSS